MYELDVYLFYIKMSENTDLTYYQRNNDLILSKKKDYYKSNKESQENRREITTKAYLKKKKIKRENIGRKSIIICLNKRNRN